MGSLLLLSVIGILVFMTGIVWVCKKESRAEGKFLVLIGLIIGGGASKAFYDTFFLYRSTETTEARLIETVTLETGQTRQVIVNEDGDKEYLDSSYWHPPNTYYQITHREGTYFWIYDYKDRNFSFFTVPTTKG